MPAKTPIYLKTTTDRKGRRLKLRDILSGDMISPPLGDVRHSAHVGSHGLDDMFGDVGFLQGSMDMLPSLRALHNGNGSLSQALNSQDTHQDTRPSLRALHSGDGSSPQMASNEDPLQDTLPSLRALHNGHKPCSQPPTSRDPYQDMLPSLRPLHNGHQSSSQDPYSSLSASLWSSASLPLLMAQEQAPPKPPRLHLDTTPQSDPAHSAHLDTTPQPGSTHSTHLNPPRDWDMSLSHTIQRLVPSSGSSSEDSLFDTCGPLEVPRGLSLDSDAGLSNEDLRSDGSPTSLPRTDSIMTSFNLDLGPSILDDVLSIMDRYGGSSVSPGP